MNEKYSKKDFEKILEKYSIGKLLSYKKLPKALENTVYYFKTSKGEFVLKLFERSTKTVENQTMVQEHLQKNNPIPKIIRTKNNKSISFYEKKPVQIQEFAKGKRVRLNNKLIKDYGKIIGQIDLDLKKLEIRNFFPWGKEFEFKKTKLCSNKKIDLEKEQEKILKELKKINKKKITRTIVHGDLNLDNSLIHKNKINAIIDFGDSHTGFLITDPMIFICDEIITSKMNYKKIKLFLKEFEKKIKLSKEEKKALYYFTLNRCLYSMDWCNRMQQKHENKKRPSKMFEEYLVKYKLLKQEGLERFLEEIQ